MRERLPFGVRTLLRRAASRSRNAARTLRYRAKNAVYRSVPGSVGYYRFLRGQRDPGYVHARDMHPVRLKHNADSGWTSEEGPLRRRDYASYEEYVTHQRQKLDELLKMGTFFSTNRSVVALRRRFYRRFRHLLPLLDRDALILCLGARQGTEVEVLRDLGFRNARGLDLNPGPANPWVEIGDFNDLPHVDASVDCVYSNSIDHAPDLERFFAEHARVVKPGRFALYDVGAGETGLGPAEAIAWTSDSVVVAAMIRHFEIVQAETDGGWKWFLLRRS
jgi:SAM-dependent methyltransferase